MTLLIIPAAGLSTRYGLNRPKFLLQHPSGKTMLTEGLIGLNNSPIKKILVVSLSDFFDDIDVHSIEREVLDNIGIQTNFLLLEKSTTSMVDTIRLGIEHTEVDTSIVVKDVDNYIEPGNFDTFGDNFVVYASLQKYPKIIAGNKSFIEIDENGYLANIVEKRVISSDINTGLIGFKNASDFLRMSSMLLGSEEKYVSDVIRIMLQKSISFKTVEASAYVDWGDLDGWLSYIDDFATIFIDIDGVLALNEDPHGKNGNNWNRLRPIHDNVNVLLEGERLGHYSLVFTTARSESFRANLTKQLTEIGFRKFQLVLGLPHAKRIVVNDFAPTNPYPSAVAINLPRNANNLAQYLK